MSNQYQLTDLQTSILRLLWQRGEATVAELWEALYPERGLAQTTIATIVARLQRRGVLARRSRDRQFVYRALVTEPDVRHSMVKELIERLFDGDVAALVNHVVSDRHTTPGDLARIREVVEKLSPRSRDT